MFPKSARLRGETAAVAALTVAGLALRLIGLARQSIWVDECFTMDYACTFTKLTREMIFLNIQGPFHAIILHAWTSVFGMSEYSLRLPEALVGAATIPLFWWALRPMGRPSVAVLGAALIALSPFHLWYSQEARNYSFLMFFAVLSMGIWLRVETWTWTNWAAYTATGILGLLSNLGFLFLLAAQAIWLVVTGDRRHRLLKGAAVGWVVMALAISPWAIQFWHRMILRSGALTMKPVAAESRLRGETTAPVTGIPYTYFVFSIGYSYGPSLRELHKTAGEGIRSAMRGHEAALAFAALVFGTAAILGLIRLWRSGPAGRAWLIVLLVPALMTWVVAWRNVKVMNPRYAATAFPAWLVLIASGLLAPGRRWIRYVLIAAALVPTISAIAGYETDPRYWKEDARGVDQLLRAAAGPDDATIVIGSQVAFTDYYWLLPGRKPPAGDVFMHESWIDLPKEQRWPRLEQVVARHRRVYVVFLRPQDQDPAGEWPPYLDEHHPTARRVEFIGAEVRVIEGGLAAGEKTSPDVPATPGAKTSGGGATTGGTAPPRGPAAGAAKGAEG